MSIEIVMVKTKNLKPAEYNPRLMSKHDADQLAHSMTEFGVVDPIIVNSHPSRNNIIIGGHQRYYIAKQLNYEELPVVYVSIEDIKREKELNVRLNKNVGEWDWEKLANEFDVDFLKELGFTDKEMSIDVAEKEIEIKNCFELIIECESENDLKEKFEEIKDKGYKCRLSIF